MPGTEEAIKAASHQGYEAILLVIVVLAMLGAFGILVRFLLNTTSAREKALSDRINQLEQFIQTTLVDLVAQCTESNNHAVQAMHALTESLKTRPCFLEQDQQEKVVDRLADRLGTQLGR